MDIIFLKKTLYTSWGSPRVDGMHKIQYGRHPNTKVAYLSLCYQ